MPKCAPGCECGRHKPSRRRNQEKACEECGSPFSAHRADAQFCSAVCWRQAYYRENREKVQARNRQWMMANRERVREIQRRHDERKGRARKRQRYASDSEVPERVRERRQRNREYYQANSDRLREYQRQRRLEYPALVRRAQRRAQHGGDWDAIFGALWEAQGGRCYLCGDPLRRDADRDIHLDHDHSCCGPLRTCENCRRGLACKRCNLIIGMAADDPARLRRIADGLEAVQLSHGRPPG